MSENKVISNQISKKKKILSSFQQIRFNSQIINSQGNQGDQKTKLKYALSISVGSVVGLLVGYWIVNNINQNEQQTVSDEKLHKYKQTKLVSYLILHYLHCACCCESLNSANC